jgi:pilus assembly protein Flp/PilA
MFTLRQILSRKEGQGMAEYALILALVAVVAIVGLKYLGPKVYDMFRYIAGELSR